MLVSVYFKYSSVILCLINKFTFSLLSVNRMESKVRELSEKVDSQGREIMRIRNEADQKWVEISGKDVPVSIILNLLKNCNNN